MEQSLQRCALTWQKSAEDENPGIPPGDLDAWRVTESSPFDFASVEYIVSNASITEAWKKVRSNKGAPGCDGISIENFRKWVRLQWHDIKKQLLKGAYVSSPALRVEIPKESGGVRRLGIPRVLDRVLMQSMAKVLGDIFNPTFSENSFGYMPHRSVQQAARRAQPFYRQGYTIQIDIDLEKLFDTVNHDVLMERVARKVKNKGPLRLLGRFLRAGVMVDGRLQPTRQWRRPRRKIGKLIKLGVGKRDAIRLGLSRKSYWRLSTTLGTNMGLSNAHFEEIGLISLRTLWCKIHHPATAR
ncbi:MAG: reverse transcriptase domain-containing protein [Sedimenticola sp.]